MFKEDSSRVSREVEASMPSSTYKIRLMFPSCWVSLGCPSLWKKQSGLDNIPESLSKITTTEMASQDNHLRPAIAKKQVSYTEPAAGAPAHQDFGPGHNSSSLNRASYERPASKNSEKPFSEDLEAANNKPIPVRPTLFDRTFTQHFRAAEAGEAEVDFAGLSQKEKRHVVKSGVNSYIQDANFKNRTQFPGHSGSLWS